MAYMQPWTTKQISVIYKPKWYLNVGLFYQDPLKEIAVSLRLSILGML